MPFKRFTDPSYDLGVGGSFPGTVFGEAYDRVNVVSGGTGAGGSALVAGAKGTGPNAGTFFVAFGEDGLSAHVNRGLKVLTENTDHLDNIVHRDLVEPVRSATVVSAGDTSTTLDGSTQEIFVGNGGATASGTFILVDSLDQPIFDPATGDLIFVASIAGATLGTGYTAANPLTLNFSGTVPAAVAYRILHGRRSNVAVQPDELATSLGLPAGMITRGFMTGVLRGGLDRAYRNGTTAAAAALNTAGAGRTIRRDGAALRVNPTESKFDDPIGASFKSESSDSTDGYASGLMAGSGFVTVVGNRFLDDVNEKGPMTNAGAFGTVWPHDHEGDIANARTRVTTTKTGKLNPGSAGGDIVQLGAGDFWYDGTPESAVAVGYDMVEVTRNSGDVEVYIIRLLDTGNSLRAFVIDLTGESPSFPADEDATFRWISTSYWQGPPRGRQEAQLGVPAPFAAASGLGGLIHIQHPRLRTSQLNTAAYNRFALLTAEATEPTVEALVWTGFDYDATGGAPGITAALVANKYTAALRGDGSVSASQRSEFELLATRDANINSLPASPSPITWDPRQGSMLVLRFTTDGENLAVNLDAAYTADAQDGDTIIVFVLHSSAAGTSVITWDSAFKFSSTGDALPSVGAGAVTKWIGHRYESNGVISFFMTKTAYP